MAAGFMSCAQAAAGGTACRAAAPRPATICKRWSHRGLWARIFAALAAQAGLPGGLRIDSTAMHAHRFALGAARVQAFGRSPGGPSRQELRERAFCRLKHRRRIAARYDRLAVNTGSAVAIAASCRGFDRVSSCRPVQRRRGQRSGQPQARCGSRAATSDPPVFRKAAGPARGQTPSPAASARGPGPGSDPADPAQFGPRPGLPPLPP